MKLSHKNLQAGIKLEKKYDNKDYFEKRKVVVERIEINGEVIYNEKHIRLHDGREIFNFDNKSDLRFTLNALQSEFGINGWDVA